MIVTDDFIWGHIPKTGGTSVWKFFDKHLLHKIKFRSAKHIPFSKMNDEYMSKKYYLANNKKVKVSSLVIPNYKIANFRRLPDRLVSLAFFLKKRHNTPILKKHLVRGLEYDKIGANISPSDIIIKNWDLNGADFIVRCERMYEDWNYLFHKFDYNITMTSAHFNKTDRPSFIDFFSKNELVQIYKNNPLWQSLEYKVYGSLPI